MMWAALYTIMFVTYATVLVKVGGFEPPTQRPKRRMLPTTPYLDNKRSSQSDLNRHLTFYKNVAFPFKL